MGRWNKYRLSATPASLLLVVLAVLPGSAEESAMADPQQVLGWIRGVNLDSPQAVQVRDLDFSVGPAQFHLGEGMLFPGSSVGARALEFVFIGSGTIRMEAGDPIERHQLDLFTDRDDLDVEFSELVLVVPDPVLGQTLLGAEPTAAVDDAVAAQAKTLFESWKNSGERKILGVETALFQAAVGSGMYEGFFLAWIRGSDLDDFVYMIHPQEVEQITLGRFVPLDATRKEKRKILRRLHAEQKHGRFLGLEVEELGTWDNWFSSSLRSGERPFPGSALFEPEHYTLEIEVTQENTRLKGRATIDLVSKSFGQRTVELQLSPYLNAERITDSSGAELFFVSDQSALIVVLPKAAQPSERISLTVVYEGTPLEKVGRHKLVLNNTVYWYPHAGIEDMATYDVTLRYPATLDLLASGVKVDEGEDSKGQTRWDRRKLDYPTKAFSFEVGSFEMETLEVGHVQVTMAFDRSVKSHGKANVKEVQSALADSLAYYEELFGPYPLDHLTVVTVERGFSQGLLGFVTLSNHLFDDLDQFDRLLGITDRRIIVAHEMAHQWWGHVVTWSTYRDQWISEAMAEYASFLFAKNKLEWTQSSGMSPTARWRDYLLSTTEEGLTIESLGPLVLGRRLNSSLASGAYEQVVYKKGLLILNMLGELLGEERFTKALKHAVKLHGGQAITTENLVAAIEQASGVQLDRFAAQYIYGTGLPEIYYRFEFEPQANGKWRVKGQANQQPFYGYRFSAVDLDDGRTDVAQERMDSMNVEKSELVIPMAITVYSASAATGKGKKQALEVGNAVLNAKLRLTGEHTPFEFEVPHEPKDLWLDPYGEALAQFYCETREPKRVLYFLGLDHAAEGEFDEAAGYFRRALDAEMVAEGTKQNVTSRTVSASMARVLDASIQIELASLYMDHNQDENAEEVVRDAIKNPYASGPRLELVRGRLELRQGKEREAFRRLKRLVSSKGYRTKQGYALLAIAAKRVGEQSVYLEARHDAERLDVDMTALDD